MWQTATPDGFIKALLERHVFITVDQVRKFLHMFKILPSGRRKAEFVRQLFASVFPGLSADDLQGHRCTHVRSQYVGVHQTTLSLPPTPSSLLSPPTPPNTPSLPANPGQATARSTPPPHPGSDKFYQALQVHLTLTRLHPRGSDDIYPNLCGVGWVGGGVHLKGWII